MSMNTRPQTTDHKKWRPGIFVSSDLLEAMILDKNIPLAIDVVQYTDYILKELKRRQSPRRNK